MIKSKIIYNKNNLIGKKIVKELQPLPNLTTNYIIFFLLGFNRNPINKFNPNLKFLDILLNKLILKRSNKNEACFNLNKIKIVICKI